MFLALASLYGVISNTRANLAAPSESLLTEPLTIEIDKHHLLSLRGRNVPTEQVLKAIAETASLDLHIVGGFSKNISFNVERQPVLKTLLRVLRDQNFVSRHIFTRYDKTGRRVIQPGQLWVYSFESDRGFAPMTDEPTQYPVTDGGQTETSESAPSASDNPSDQQLFSSIEGALKSGDEMALESDIQALLDIQGEQGVTTLLLLAKRQNAEMREEIADTLADIDSENRLDVLDQMIADEAPNVRKAVVQALGEVGDDRAAQVLAGALHDPDPDLREQVVDTLGDIGSASAIELLREAVSDPDPDISEAAQTYLDDLLNPAAESYY